MKELGLDIGYVRVSTDEQGKFGFSIIDQKNEIMSYAERNNIVIDRFYEDDGYSATTLKRPNVQKLLKLVAEGKVRRIFIRHSDRLIRNLLLQRSLQKIFEMFKVTVVSLNFDTDCSTPEKAFQTDFSGLLNEFEVKKVSPRTRKGLRGSASSGNYSVGGKPPLGYKREKNEKLGKGSYLIIDKEQGEVIVKIFNTLASNRVTVTDMAKYLNKNRVLNRRWNIRQLFRMLDNPIYYGKFEQDWYEEEGHTIPLVDKDLWDEVQTVIHKKKRGTVNFYLFKRVVQCKDCGCYTVLESSNKARKRGYVTYRYYKCPMCCKRINEKLVKKEFVNSFSLSQTDVLDQYYIKKLKKKIELKRNRIELMNKDFDNNLMEEEYYSIEIKKVYKDIKSLNKEITDFSKNDLKDFEALTNMQKRALILSNVEKIIVSFKNEEISIKFKDSEQKKTEK